MQEYLITPLNPYTDKDTNMKDEPANDKDTTAPVTSQADEKVESRNPR